jgi:predicted AAA+ superfamily ATPase
LGPRRTGKSTIIRHDYGSAKIYNLLQADTFLRLSQNPAAIREALTAKDKIVVIDEIQKLPALLDEVHLMIEEKRVRFLLTGSSPRKLRRQQGSLMAGRARSLRLYPFVSAEVGAFDLNRVLTFGMLPPIFGSDEPWPDLQGYVGEYLQEEIRAEALARNIEAFSRFLRQAALTHAEILNFESVARDAQVPARTIREYYAVLADTLMGTMLEPLHTRGQRKSVSKAKFYFFDIGVAHALTGEDRLAPDSPAYGKAFESFVFMELNAYAAYFADATALNFWHTQTQDEVDFVYRGEIAIEVKAAKRVTTADLRGLQRLHEEKKMRRRMIVCREPERRRLGDVEIWPIKEFCEALWAHEIIER